MDRKIKTKSLKIMFIIIMAVSLAPFLATATEVSAQSTLPNGGNQNNAPSSTGINNAPGSIPQTQTSAVTIHDKINSTFTVSKDDPNATRILTRALRDRVDDLVHTVALRNATITISDAKITNGLTNETIILSNNITSINSSVRRLANNILGGTTSTTGSSAVQLNLITEMTCMNNINRSSANCSIHLIIGR
ncbi:MAG TPA: hypothetical protein VE199_04925 [Nitrososphaera sp.]|nr:hypothetical protein [Nitrososphaera sp.]